MVQGLADLMAQTERRKIRAIFSKGLDAGGTDPKLVTEGFLRMDNAEFPRRGCFKHRDGSTALTGTYSSERFISSYKNSPVLFGESFYTFDNDGTDIAGSFVQQSSGLDVPLVSHTVAVESDKTYPVFNLTSSHAISGDYIIVGYPYNPKRPAAVLNRHTGDVVALAGNGTTDYQDSSCRWTKCVATANGNLFAFYASDSGSPAATIDYVKWDGSTLTTGSSVPVGSYGQPDVSSGFDAVAIGSNKVAFAYYSNNTSGYCIQVWDTVGNTIDGEAAGTASYEYWSVFPWPNQSPAFGLVASIPGSNTIRVECLSDTMSAVFTADTATSTAKPYSITGVCHDPAADAATLLVTERDTDDLPRTFSYPVTESGGALTIGSGTQLTANASLCSKAFADSSQNVYHVGYHQNGMWWLDSGSVEDLDRAATDRTYFLFRGGVVCAKFLVGRAGHDILSYDATYTSVPGGTGTAAWFSQCLSEVSQDPDDTDKFHFSGLIRTAPKRNARARVVIDLSPDSIRTIEANDVLAIPGSLGYEYDGDSVTEQGYLQFPEAIRVAHGAGATTWDATSNVVTFAATYERTDAQGNIVRSAPSAQVSFTIATNNEIEVKVTLPTIGFTELATDIVLYCTQENGSTLYEALRRRVVDGGAYAGGDGFYTFTVTKTTLDSQLTGSLLTPKLQALYTTGNALSNIQPRGHSVAELHQDAYFHVDATRPKTDIYYSKRFFPGLGIEHSDELYVQCSPWGGEMNALVSMDEKLFIFKERAIFVTQGTPPSSTGLGGGYVQPRMIDGAIGCKHRNAVARIPQGIMFLSDSGIYLLTRGEQVQFIGHGVRYYTDTYNYCCATTVPEKHIAIFSSRTSGDAADALVYNYLYEQWSAWNGPYTSVKGVTRANGRAYVFDDTDDKVYAMNSSTVLDNGSTNFLVAHTGWFIFDELDGYANLDDAVLLADNNADHTLRVKAQYNHEPYWEFDETYDSSALENYDYTSYYGGGLTSVVADNAYKLSISSTRRRIDSIRYAFQSTGDVTITALTFNVSVKRGLTRLGSARVLDS